MMLMFRLTTITCQLERQIRGIRRVIGSEHVLSTRKIIHKWYVINFYIKIINTALKGWILNHMSKVKIKKADVLPKGTQLKMLFYLEGNQKVRRHEL